MNCQQALQGLGDFVDSELDRATRKQLRSHLDSCPSCMEAYREVISIKRLVQTKLSRPPLPGGLSGRVFRATRPEAQRVSRLGRFQRRLIGLAAAFLLGAVAWITYILVTDDSLPPLVHAEAMREIADRFEQGSDSRTPLSEEEKNDQRLLLEKIERTTGITLERLPELRQARLLGWKATTLAGRPCVRLDYQDEYLGGRNQARRGCSAISIFALPISSVELPKPLIENLMEVHHCRCIQVKDGPTIYCFRDRLASLNILAWANEEEIHSRLKR